MRGKRGAGILAVLVQGGSVLCVGCPELLDLRGMLVGRVADRLFDELEPLLHRRMVRLQRSKTLDVLRMLVVGARNLRVCVAQGLQVALMLVGGVAHNLLEVINALLHRGVLGDRAMVLRDVSVELLELPFGLLVQLGVLRKRVVQLLQAGLRAEEPAVDFGGQVPVHTALSCDECLELHDLLLQGEQVASKCRGLLTDQSQLRLVDFHLLLVQCLDLTLPLRRSPRDFRAFLQHAGAPQAGGGVH
mmetsp:Transcript_12549/g.35961  ORF Transcript_12549/g.35961 Transcript_12549/m.35961 type:complete len:246 (-) Transcript_12549:139-876(-)